MTVSLSPGDVIDGTYVIERLLGQGGMGAVFLAREERLGRKVALKVLLSAVADNAEAVVRFEREARSAAALHSDHVTRVLSVGRLPGGAPYIVMELLEGEDLSVALAKQGALGVDEVVSYMMQVCDALAEAHALGIVHRDLKPANIFLARRPGAAGARVKVLDFGISKSPTGSASESLTKTTALMGTPLYMSPEQLREARNVDGRADLWALGIIMYELISGKPPFLSDALAELCVFIMTTPHEPLIGRRPHVPPALDAIVNRCLEKDPTKRFANANELMAALSAVSPRAGSSPGLQAAPHVAPQSATPRMNPVMALPTAGIGGTRARMQAPTAAQGQAPYPVTPSPVLPQTPPPGPSPHAPTPMMTLPKNLPPGPFPATADPVSSTQPWLPSKGPNVLGLVLVFSAALIIGGGTLFALFLRTPSTEQGPASASGGSSATSGLVMSDPSPSATTASSPSSSASAAPPAIASALPAVTIAKPPPAVVAAPPPLALPPPGPLPPPGVIARPPIVPPPVVVAPLAPLAPPSGARVVPSAKPAAPPSNSGSLMPGARTL